MKVKVILYGVCRDGLVFSSRYEHLGCTGILRWGATFRPAEWRLLKTNMLGALQQMYREATAPSRNSFNRARYRAQA
jgi:hypothetical protein